MHRQRLCLRREEIVSGCVDTCLARTIIYFMKEKKQSGQKDAYTIELEHIHSDFGVFGESLDLIRDEVKNHTHGLSKIDERLTNIDERLMNMEADLEFVKSELGIIRHNQITRDEFKLLETRVARLERKLR